MANTLNYNIKFTTNANKINAGVDRLDKSIGDVSKGSRKMSKRFGKAMDKMNKKLSTVAMDSFINNIQHASEGLKQMSAPGIELNSTLGDLQAITGLAGDKLKQLETAARENAKTFGGSAAEGVNTYKLILSQLGPELAKTPDVLNAMAKNANVLSKTMGGDTTAATEVLTTAINQFQVSLEDPIEASAEMSRMMNVMASAAKAGSAELPQQKQALEQSGLAAKTAKVSFEETAAAIQVLDKAGKKGSEGGVALRNTLTTLSRGRFLPKDVQEELRAAGVNVNDLSDKSKSLTERLKPLQSVMDDTALITKLFGRENSSAAVALISQIEEQEKLTDKVKGTNTAMEQANAVMETQAEKNKRLKAQVDDFKISLFNASNGAIGYASVLGEVAFSLSNLIPLFSGAMQAVTWLTRAKNLDMIATKAQVSWTAIETAAKYTATAATSALSVAQNALNAAFLASPIGWIVLGIGALVAIVVTCWNKFEGFRKVVFQAWEVLKNFGKAIYTYVITRFKEMLSGITGVGDALVSFFTGDWSKALEKGQQAINDLSGINSGKKLANDMVKGYNDGIKSGAKRSADYTANMNDDQKAKGKKDGQAYVEGHNKAVKNSNKVPYGPKENGANPNGQSNQTKGLLMNNITAFNGQKNKDKESGEEGKKTNEAIATGGQSNNYVTISLNELVGNLNIKGNDFKDSAKQMEDQSVNALKRVLAMAATAN